MEICYSVCWYFLCIYGTPSSPCIQQMQHPYELSDIQEQNEFPYLPELQSSASKLKCLIEKELIEGSLIITPGFFQPVQMEFVMGQMTSKRTRKHVSPFHSLFAENTEYFILSPPGTATRKNYIESCDFTSSLLTQTKVQYFSLELPILQVRTSMQFWSAHLCKSVSAEFKTMNIFSCPPKGSNYKSDNTEEIWGMFR